MTLWNCFDVWNTTARTARDNRRALVCKAKALIEEDRKHG
jgi:hypothetical protein